jgi:hypothetical protein
MGWVVSFFKRNSMITVFTTAKPFVGQMKTNQINAIKSWKQLGPDIEILLFGQGEGYSEVARELDLVWIDRVATSDYGTPLVDNMFELAKRQGHYSTRMYINCDIVLIGNFPSILMVLGKRDFLAVGQRWDMKLDEEIDFGRSDWRQFLQSSVRQVATLHPPQGSDYFLYRGDIWDGLPKLVVGRAGYDNNLIYHCRSRGIPVVDLTDAVMAIHQNHDYGHHSAGYEGVFFGPEAQLNYQVTDQTFYFTPVDADFRMSEGKLKRNYGRGDAIRYLRSLQPLCRREWALLISIGLIPLRIARRILKLAKRQPKPF